MRRLVVVSLVLVATVAIPVAARPVPIPVAAEALVRFHPGTSEETARAAIRAAGASVIRAMDVTDAYHLRAADVPSAVTALRANPAVRLAHPNNRYRIAWRPNDPQLGLQWALENRGQTVNGLAGSGDADIDALEAWDRSTGNGIVVATIDTGIDAFHADLAPALWTNPGETAGNGSDDDGNGKIDDVHGWDVVGGDNDPSDTVGHGTHVAGVLAARAGNGTGIAGVAPGVVVMPVRAVPDDGSATDVMLADGIAYAADNGARIINISLSGPDDGGILASVMRERPGILFVVAAGNESSDVDETPTYPCALDVANLMCVASSNQRDARADSSNWGDQTVEVVAPGDNVLTAAPGGGYAYLSGTSIASPHAAGVAALAWSAYAASPALDVRRALMDGVDRPGGLAGLSISGGRINAPRAIDVLARLQPFSILAPAGLSSPVLARFRHAARNVRANNVVVRPAGSTVDLPATQVCRASNGGVTSCQSGEVATVSIQPAAPLTAGQHYQVLLNPPGAPAVTNGGGTAMTHARIPFRASLIEQEWTPSGAQGWRIAGNSAAYGGSYAVEHLPGARVHHRFRGSSITWYTVAGPDQGSAVVLIDGQHQATIGNHAARRAWRVGHTFAGLLNAVHTMTIIARGDGQVAVDAVRTAAGLNQAPALTYQWRIVTRQGASDGRFVEADYAGAALSFTFRGTGVDWYPVRTAASGKANVYLDGRLISTADTYASSATLNRPVGIRGLSDTLHVLRIVVLGQRRSGSRGTLVATDKYVVR